MEEIKISEDKLEFYENMVDKWANHSFEKEEDKKEFILLLKNLLGENENDIEFEAIIYFVNYLSGCIPLKKFDYHSESQNTEQPLKD